MSKEHGRMKLVLLVAALAGCATKPNPASCADDHCNDPARPFCDEDGAIAGEPDTCIAVECSPGEFAACRGDNALTCDATGNNYDELECVYGCSAEAGGCNDCNTSDCEKHIIPKYLPNICNQPIGGDPLSLGTSTFDTTNELNCQQVVAQSEGPEICVLHRSAITVEPGQEFHVTGTRAIALVSDGDLHVDGIIDVSSNLFEHGPGGGAFSGPAGTTPDGGGGAGFKTAGGAGGSTTADGGGASGGDALPDPLQLSYLPAGTSPGLAPLNGYFGGPAGGALTLISCRATVSISGTIDAGGGGGYGGFINNAVSPPVARPAAGGGSGGYVVIQGMNVSITGQLFANGGGGGAGGKADVNMGGAGQDGPRSTSAALGAASTAGEGGGGNGGFGTTPPGVGRKPTTTGSNVGAGAGGGSVGMFQTLTPEGVNPTLTPLAASPPLPPNVTVPTN